jgi:hypothetical protein
MRKAVQYGNTETRDVATVLVRKDLGHLKREIS